MATRIEKKLALGEEPPSGQQPSPGIDRDWLFGAVLVLAVILVYLPVLHAGFIWDDEYHVTGNPCVVGPLGLKEIWTTSYAQYYPLATTTFWLEYKLWGPAPAPFHFVNVLMHAASAVVLWRLLRVLRVPGAWFGSALWALHPISVETVAWITELMNVQSCFFYLLTLLFFAKSLRTETPGTAQLRYGLSVVFAILAMTSKSSTVVLPLVLCLCAWWMEGRWQWRNLLRTAPFFPMSAIAAFLAVWTVQQQGVFVEKDWVRTWPERFVTAGDVIWFYLGKLAWPHPLMLIYPRWVIHGGEPLAYIPLVLAVVAFAVLGWGMARALWVRACFFGYAYFLIVLLPVLGLVEHNYLHYTFVADHLQYLASIGPLALAGAGLTLLAQRLLQDSAQIRALPAAALLLLLGFLSWQRTWAFEDVRTLWTDALAKNPNCWLAYTNLADLAFQAGRTDEAIRGYDAALKIQPNLYDIEYDLGNAYASENRLEDAVVHYRNAFTIRPGDAVAHINLGLVYLRMGRVDDAIAEYRAGLGIAPGLAIGHYNLGSALKQTHQLDEAIAEYRRAIELNPGYAKAHNALGLALTEKGDRDGGAKEYVAALQLDPRLAEAHYNYANYLLGMRVFEPAIEQYRTALALDPGSVKAHNNLGSALAESNRPTEAIPEFEQALKLDPTFSDAQRNLDFARAAAEKQKAVVPAKAP